MSWGSLPVNFAVTAGLGLVSAASPACMTNMPVRQTGRRLLEKRMARFNGAAYADYVRRTNGFILWALR